MQAAISNTISTLYSDSQPILTNQSSPRILCLAPADDEIVEFLQKLTTQANDAASSLACGSILAGHSSESDEFGDIAFHIGSGDYAQGNEMKVLQALQVSQSWAHGNVSQLSTDLLHPHKAVSSAAHWTCLVRHVFPGTSHPQVPQLQLL
jgi:hypothetical protein